MDKELAKHQKLNWQALLIEETQSDLKLLIKDLILSGKSFREINKKVVERIKKCVDELEIDTLKISTEKGLLVFASRVYVILNNLFNGLSYASVIALSKVANGQGTYEQNKQVRQLMDSDIKTAYNIGMPLDMYSKDYMDLVRKRIDFLSQLEAKEDYTTRLTLRNLAEINVRRERHEKELQDLIDKGVDLVWIIPHANCSKRCEPFQGKLYSISGKHGSIDGFQYEPLTNATDVYEVTKAGKIYKNGCISGFNCRHTLEPYHKKNKPIQIPAEVIEKQRKIEQRQRYLERGIRSWKDRALLYKDIDYKEYLFARRKAIEWNKRYIQYSRENDVPYYPSRTQVI